MTSNPLIKNNLVLAFSAYYHDSAAVIFNDGKVVAGIEEERFTRVKHDNSFPVKSIQFCLDQAGVKIEQVGAVVYYEKTLLKFERVLENFVKTYPFSYRQFIEGMPEWLGKKLSIEKEIRKRLKYKGNIYYVPHHLSHAAAAFFPSPFKTAAILTIDGVGEYTTTGLWKGDKNTITKQTELIFPHSLGLLYSTFTAFLGFRVNEDEWKMMGLAAYGKPNFLTEIKKIIKIKEDGSFRLDMDYFGFTKYSKMWSNKFEKLFGKPRNKIDNFEKKHKDIAASVQAITEEIYFKILNHLYKLTETRNVCISGGVALNALANGKIWSNTPFENIYILGVTGDNGAALGAGLAYWHINNNNKTRYPIKSLDYGTEYNNEQIKKALDETGMNYQKYSMSEIIDKSAKALADGKVVGWFQGKMELGPRALGRRSILARTWPRTMKERVNMIKIREQFRPFAGSVIQENVQDYFEVPENNHWSPFMIFCFTVKKEKRNDLAAIVHRDNTCRIQTVSAGDGSYYDLIKKYKEITGVGCILNTSFNLKGEPIVDNPQQAIDDFNKTAIDYLAIGNYWVSKNNPGRQCM